MSRRRWTYLLCAAALVGGLLSISRAHEHEGLERFRGQPPSPVIFPAQQIPLAFSHVSHLKRDKLNCDFCHEDAPDSRSSLDDNVPKEEQCAICHEIDRSQPDKQVEPGKPRADCESCHPGYRAGGGQVARVVIPAPNLKFNHKAHVDKAIRCILCHGDLLQEEVSRATRDQLPRMRLCLTCHDGREAPSRCTTCHLADAGGLVRTTYEQGVLVPSGVLRGDTHDLNFRMDHARVAKDDSLYCGNCHRKEFCVGCHNGSVKPMDFHGNDYVSLHAIDARRNNPDCSACHRLQTFCVGCHSRSGVTEEREAINDFIGPLGVFHDTPVEGELEGSLTHRFHPAGWVENPALPSKPGGGAARSPGHHSFEAQRNIRQCASCHREQFCIQCHSSPRAVDDIARPGNPYRWNRNPHGPGWRNSGRCESLLARSGRMCLRCHTDPNHARCDWCADAGSTLDPACR